MHGWQDGLGGGLLGDRIHGINNTKRGSSTIASGAEWRGAARLSRGTPGRRGAWQMRLCSSTLLCLAQSARAGEDCAVLLVLGGRAVVLVGGVGRAVLHRGLSGAGLLAGEAWRSMSRQKRGLSAAFVFDRQQERRQKPWARRELPRAAKVVGVGSDLVGPLRRRGSSANAAEGVADSRIAAPANRQAFCKCSPTLSRGLIATVLLAAS